MKKIVSVFLLLFAASVVNAQKKANFQFLGGNDQMEFYVNYKDGSGTYENVTFFGAILFRDGSGSLSTFRGNCKERTAAIIKTDGKVEKKPVLTPVPKGSAIEAALDLTCNKRFGDFI